jgi:hypothetical protein
VGSYRWELLEKPFNISVFQHEPRENERILLTSHIDLRKLPPEHNNPGQQKGRRDQLKDLTHAADRTSVPETL